MTLSSQRLLFLFILFCSIVTVSPVFAFTAFTDYFKDSSDMVRKYFGLGTKYELKYGSNEPELAYILPRTAREMYKLGQKVEEPKLGDLIFFKTYADYPSHVGIWMGNGYFMHLDERDRELRLELLNCSKLNNSLIGYKRINTSDGSDPDTIGDPQLDKIFGEWNGEAYGSLTVAFNELNAVATKKIIKLKGEQCDCYKISQASCEAFKTNFLYVKGYIKMRALVTH